MQASTKAIDRQGFPRDRWSLHFNERNFNCCRCRLLCATINTSHSNQLSSERQLPAAWQMPCQHFAIFGESHRQHWIRLARGLNTSHKLLFKLFLCVTGQPKSIFTTSIKANCLVSHILGRFIGCHKMWRALLKGHIFLPKYASSKYFSTGYIQNLQFVPTQDDKLLLGYCSWESFDQACLQVRTPGFPNGGGAISPQFGAL